MIGALWWFLFFHRCFHLTSAYSEKAYEFFVTEESPKNTFVGKITVSPDETYRISSPNPSVKNLFRIDFKTGSIRTLDRIDRDTLDIFNNSIDIIIVSQSASLISITIHVWDINDNPPSFLHQFYNISIVEGAAISSRYPLQIAKDLDYGINGTIAAYHLKSDNPETLKLFKLNRITDIVAGDALFLELISPLDREEHDNYTLEVEAIDGGIPALTGSSIIFVTVLDVNDNVPVFESLVVNVTLENYDTENDTIAIMEAHDADVGLNSELIYSLADNAGGQFEIDEVLGVVRKKVKDVVCNKDTCALCLPSICVLSVEASDKGAPRLIGRAFLNVHLKSHHRNLPQIHIKIYPSNSNHLIIDENTEIGSTLAVLTITDPASKAKILNQVSIISGNDDNIFGLELGQGFAILRLAKKVDYKKQQTYTLTFETIGNDTSRSQKSLEVYVRNVNERPPIFTQNHYTTSIKETAWINSFVLQVHAESDGDLIYYSIGNSTAIPFVINPHTGVIKLVQPLNYSHESVYEFQVKASKPPPSWKSGTANIRINILECSKQAPMFIEKVVKLSLKEDHDISLPVFKAKCLTRGEYAVTKYKLNSDRFQIDEDNGKLYLKKELDYEKSRNYALNIFCYHLKYPWLTDQQKLIIAVEDVNDNIPHFEPLFQHVTIQNNDPSGSDLAVIKAKDADAEDASNLTYFLVNAPIGFIDIEKATGRVYTTKPIDIHTIGSTFNVTIGAKDSQKHLSSKDAVITVHVIDNLNDDLLFDQTQWVVTIVENTPSNYLIGKFTASSMSNDTIEYFLIEGNNALNIDKSTGNIRTTTIFDYEETKEISFTVMARTSKNAISKNGTLEVIDINDNRPVFINPSRFTVDLSNQILGEAFGRVKATDADSGSNGEIIYTSQSEFLLIDNVTGLIWLNPKLASSKENQLQVKITATDQGKPNLSTEQTLIIDLMQNTNSFLASDFPNQISLTTIEDSINLNTKGLSGLYFQANSNISEFADILSTGEVYFTPNAYQLFYKLPYQVENTKKSKVVNELIIYPQMPVTQKINCQQNIVLIIPESAIPGSSFYSSIIEESDVIVKYKLLNEYETFSLDESIGSVMLLNPLDAEIRQNFTLAIEASTKQNYRIQCPAKIIVEDKNDHSPIFDKSFYYVEISDNETGVIVQVKATDADISHEFNQIIYSLESSDRQFSIDKNTGKFTKLSKIEPNHLYNITVFASNPDSVKSQTFILIKVLPDVTSSPVLLASREVIVSELEPLGSVIATISALSDHQTVQYQIIDGNLFSTFEIDADYGKITVTRLLDYEKIQNYTLTILAQTTAANATSKIIIKVKDERDVIPVISTGALIVQENQKPKTLVGSLQLEEIGSLSLSEFNIEILYQNPPIGRFYIDNNNEVYTGNWIDRESMETVQLLISIDDKQAKHLRSEKLITIKIGDENDNVPECGAMNAVLVPKKTSFPKKFQLHCYDKDAGYNASLGYKSTTESSEIILESNGMLIIKDSPKEALKNFSFMVADRTLPETRNALDALRTSSNSKITLIKENEGKVFTHVQSTFTIPRTAHIPSVIATLPTQRNTTRCFISHQTIQTNIFSLSEEKPELLLIKPLPPTDQKFHLDVIGFDTVTHKTQIHKVTIEVDDHHASGHFVVPALAYEFYVNENISIGESFEKLQVLGTSLSNLKFQFENSEADIPFQINEKTGEIYAKGEVDYEKAHFYQNEVIISSKSQTATVPVIFHITDCNDNAPEFKEKVFYFFILENSKPGDFVGHVIAFDRDNDGRGRVRYQLSKAPARVFTLDTISGIITLEGELDRELQAFYEFEVRAYDIDGLEATTTVFVFIDDVNDNAPQFDNEVVKVSIAEDAVIGTLVCSLNYEDADIVNNFNFEISPSTNGFEHFRIDNYGKIYVNNHLDRELISRYQLLVTLKDSYYPFTVHQATKTVTIIVEDINDNPPTFTSNYTFVVNEAAPIGTVIGTAVAADMDANALGSNSQIQYSIEPFSNIRGEFAVDPLFGYIMVNKKLDREQKAVYHFTLVAENTGTLNLYSSTVVTIVVADDDDNAPVPQTLAENVYIDETVPIGTLVASLGFYDADSGHNAAVVFNIIDGNEDGWFRINPATSHVFTNRELDFEIVSEFALNISMEAVSGKYDPSYIQLGIFLNDKNDEKPVFQNGNFMELKVAENITANYPLFIYHLSTIDKDFNSSTKYSIITGNSTVFSIDTFTGDLIINHSLDYEIENIYELMIRATDAMNPNLFSELVIKVIVTDVNDNAPIFSQPYYQLTIPENSPANYTLLTVNARDADSKENGEVYYTIENKEAVPFEVDYVTGALKLTKSLDFEMQNFYKIIVRATDDGKLIQRFTDCEVRVHVKDENDNAPVLKALKQDIFTKRDVNKGSIVYVVEAYDPDVSDEITLSITGPDEKYFIIDKRGVIRTKTPLPRQSEASITVIVRDADNLTTSLPLTFYLTSDNFFPVFTVNSTRFTVSEDAKNVKLTKVTAFAFKDSCIRYHIASGNEANNFGIDPYNGEIVTKHLDYERVQEHHLYIVAMTCQSPSYTSFQQLIINVQDVNDNKPVFEKVVYEVEITENAEPKKDAIVQVHAVDADKHGKNILTYTITGGNENNAFEIDATNGKIYQLLELDREERASYILAVEAADSGTPALSEFCIVKVNVRDENDNAPRFSRLLKTYVREDAKIGEFIAQVIAFDADTPKNAKNLYSIEGDDAEYFTIDPMSGNLSLAKPLDRERQETHKIKVYAQDHLWRVAASMTIFVADVNDNAPRFEYPLYNFSVISEAAKDGYFVGIIKATDVDEGVNSKLSYYTYSPYIYVHPENGELFLTLNVSKLPFNCFQADIFVIDYGAPSQFGKTAVNVCVIDKYAEVPEFEQDEYTFALESVKEEAVIVGGVKATTNGRDNSRIRYKLLHDPEGVFIDSISGQISGNFGTLLQDDEFIIGVQAFDYQSLSTSTTKVTVKLIDEFYFGFSSKNYSFIVYENTAVNSTIGQVTTNCQFASFSLLKNSYPMFAIDRHIGRIYVSQPVDSDTNSRFREAILRVQATFNGYPSKTTTTTVKLQIIDRNDNPPIFAEAQRTIYVTSGIPLGSFITKVEAEDIDDSPFNQVQYTLSKQDYFDIGSTTGEIIATQDVDFTFSNQYSFDVIASNSNSSFTSSMTIIVQLRSFPQNTAIFTRETETFEISRRAIVSSIAGELEAHSVFGKIQYSILPNDHFFVDATTGDLILHKKYDVKNNSYITAIASSGMFNKKAPSISRIQVKTNDLAPPPVFPEKKYIIKLPANAEPLTEVLKFNFILPSDVQMEVEGKGRDSFCFDKRGVLMVCKKLDQHYYHLIMLILANGRIRSKAIIDIKIIEEKQTRSVTRPYVAYVPENLNYTVHLLRIYPTNNLENTKYEITDRFMNELFLLNSTSGILSTKTAFDREKRSLYVVPIRISSGSQEIDTTINVFVEDEDDNEATSGLLESTVFSSQPLFSGTISRAYPIDIDEVFEPLCVEKGNESHKLQLASNCSLITKELPLGKSMFEATYGNNLTYQIATNVLLNNEEISQNSVNVQMYGSRRAIADFMHKLHGGIPDMSVHYIGGSYYNNHTCELFISILTASGVVLPPMETIRILDNFVSKKSKVLDITDYRSIVSLCDNYPCGAQKCQQTRVAKKQLETFRSVNKLWTMPKMETAVKCEHNHHAHDVKEELCGNSKCLNGFCMDNTTCVCDAFYYGKTCESKVYSFGQNSYLQYDPGEPVSHLTLRLLTKEPHGLILHTQSKASNVTFVVDIVNGKLRMFTVTGEKRTSTILQEPVNDGLWHKIILSLHQAGTLSVIVETCEDDECSPCQKPSCYGTVPAVLLDSKITFGNLISTPTTGDLQTLSTSLRACLKIEEVNHQHHNVFVEHKMLLTCPLLAPNNYCDSSEAKLSCEEGSCVNDWDDYKCFCKEGYESPSCNLDDYTVSMSNPRLRLTMSPSLQREVMLTYYKNYKLLSEDANNISPLFPCDVISDITLDSEDFSKSKLDGNAVQWMEVDIRTSEFLATIFTMKYGSQEASLKLVNGSLHYGVYYSNKLIVEIIAEKFVSDGIWHRISIEVNSDGKLVRLGIDGAGKEVHSAIAFPRMVFYGLEYIDIGGNGTETYYGCMRRLIINNQVQLMYPKARSLPKQFFITSLLSQENSIHKGCDSTLACGNSITDSNAIGCSSVLMNARTRITIFIGIAVVIVSFLALLTYALYYFYRTYQKRRLSQNSQRVSNLQLVSSSINSSTYKNYSYDEFIASVLAKNRQPFVSDNHAFSDRSLDNLHIYDEAAEASNPKDITPVREMTKPIALPRSKPAEPPIKPPREPEYAKVNPYKSRFFRPSEEFGLVSSGQAIALYDFHHNPKDNETGY